MGQEKIVSKSESIGTAAVLLVVFILGSTSLAADVQEQSSFARPSRLVVVSIPDRKLAVVANGQVLHVFSVSVGAVSSPTPVGTFRIKNRVANPTYYHTGVVIPAGPSNPLGPRWLGLNKKSYGIHGTNIPSSIGKAASHGCVRLRNHDIVTLYSMLAPGDTVEIHGQRDFQTIATFGAPDPSGTHAHVALVRLTTTSVSQ